jgi:phage N-6-adenine-methyltransferase
MNDLVAPVEAHDIATLADAEHALKAIAVAESAEQLFARAKNVDALFAAIKAKLTQMRNYVIWRDGVVVPAQQNPRLRGKRAGVTELKPPLPATDPGKVVAHRWRKALKDIAAFEKAVEEAQQRSRRICEQENRGTIRGTEGTGEFERYTPAFYIEKAREVMGGIDLDPASSEYAQRTVRAAQYYTVADNGLDLSWHGRVWLNPPYHRELAPLFITKLIGELSANAGTVEQAIMLTNNSTDTEWFRAAADHCEVICFTAGRIHFEVPDRDPVLPTQGQAFFYYGQNAARFAEVFSVVGWCVEPV